MAAADLETSVCTQCGDEFTVYAIKFAGYEPYYTYEGEPLCSDNCYIEYLQNKLKESSCGTT